jgi:hypothetical protein
MKEKWVGNVQEREFVPDRKLIRNLDHCQIFEERLASEALIIYIEFFLISAIPKKKKYQNYFPET